MDPAYIARINAAWRELGIPLDYCETRGLPIVEEAPHLVVARRLPNGRELQLTPGACNAWHTMQEGAERAGIMLLLISGYRSVDRQTEILRKRLMSGETIDRALEINAAPGCSEHHSGRAVDIGTPGSPPLAETFEETAAYAWLSEHARRHGFSLSYPRDNPHGIVYEPWHWLWSREG
jgi:zinc D-Ala-D-Ala carboxypeptidase